MQRWNPSWHFLTKQEVQIETPLGRKTCSVIQEEVILVPILRAGISMLSAFQKILPHSKSGFIWAHRDRHANASIDRVKLSKEIRNRAVILLDTMLATAGTVNASVGLLEGEGPRQILCASILSTATGLEHLSDSVTAVLTVDSTDTLDKMNYIYPGVGDSGDRLYGS